jgi:anti-sigma factor RsiW
LDEVKLQSYFDGELPIEQMESVTSHLASCATCAAAARELEEESALVMNALAAEFEASVPTETLRQRIDEAVLGDRLAIARSSQKTSGFFSGLFNFGTQRALGYASLAVVLAFAAIFAVVKMKSTPETNNNVARVTTPPTLDSPKVVDNTPAQIAANRAPQDEQQPGIKVVTQRVKPARNPNFRTVNYTPSEELNAHPVKLLPGERSYLQTIAKLDSTIQSNKKSMRPALQVEYERNLAVVDRAIAATRSAAKSNPNDPDAADFMFAAYQSKVDLLNTIADARVGGGRGH